MGCMFSRPRQRQFRLSEGEGGVDFEVVNITKTAQYGLNDAHLINPPRRLS